MSAKIGILGESTAVTGAVTVYTVPEDKAARVRVLFAYESNGTSPRVVVRIGTPGSEVSLKMPGDTDDDVWTGSNVKATQVPAKSVVVADMGLQNEQAGFSAYGMASYETTDTWFIAPFPVDYFLSTGDTVRFELKSGSFTDALCQVHGVEDDA